MEVAMKAIYCNRTDFLIGVTTEEELVKISNVDGLKYIQLRQSKFTDFCLIYPTATHVVALVQTVYLSVFSVEDGDWVRWSFFIYLFVYFSY